MWEAISGGEAGLIYTFAIVFIVFSLSGVIQLIGFVNKYIAIIGSIISVAFGIIIIIFITHTPPWDINQYSTLFWRAPIVDGVWSLDIPIPIANVPNVHYENLSWGTITLIVGGGVGLIGGIFGIKDI